MAKKKELLIILYDDVMRERHKAVDFLLGFKKMFEKIKENCPHIYLTLLSTNSKHEEIVYKEESIVKVTYVTKIDGNNLNKIHLPHIVSVLKEIDKDTYSKIVFVYISNCDSINIQKPSDCPNIPEKIGDAEVETFIYSSANSTLAARNNPVLCAAFNTNKFHSDSNDLEMFDKLTTQILKSFKKEVR